MYRNVRAHHFDRDGYQPWLEGHLHHPVREHGVHGALGIHRTDHMDAIGEGEEGALERLKLFGAAGELGKVEIHETLRGWRHSISAMRGVTGAGPASPTSEPCVRKLR